MADERASYGIQQYRSSSFSLTRNFTLDSSTARSLPFILWLEGLLVEALLHGSLEALLDTFL